MSLSHGSLKDLAKLLEVKGKGAILDRHYEAKKIHVKEGNSVGNDQWEAQSTRSMKLPLGMYSTDTDAAVGLWVLREVDTAEEQDANIGAVPVQSGISNIGQRDPSGYTIYQTESGFALFCLRQSDGCV